MFIDMHVHAYLYPRPPHDGTTQFAAPGQIVEVYDKHNIERGGFNAFNRIRILSSTIQ